MALIDIRGFNEGALQEYMPASQGTMKNGNYSFTDSSWLGTVEEELR